MSPQSVRRQTERRVHVLTRNKKNRPSAYNNDILTNEGFLLVSYRYIVHVVFVHQIFVCLSKYYLTSNSVINDDNEAKYTSGELKMSCMQIIVTNLACCFCFIFCIRAMAKSK